MLVRANISKSLNESIIIVPVLRYDQVNLCLGLFRLKQKMDKGAQNTVYVDIHLQAKICIYLWA